MNQAQLKAEDPIRQSINTYNPFNGELHRTYYLQTQEEAEETIEASHNAFMKWRHTDMNTRVQVMLKMAELLERDQQNLAEMVTRQMGKPLEQAKQEVGVCAAICRYTAEHGPAELSDERRDVDTGSLGIVTYQPLGVILGMQPWNFPLYQCLRYSTAVIMAGNATVFKHARICFETAEKLEQLYLEAGLPKDVFSPIYVESEVADQLIGHPKVRGVTYTGSASIGKKIASLAGQHLKKSVMELGGSDAYLVLKDADLDEVIPTCVTGRVNNGGQTCVAAKRFIVEAPIYEEFKRRFVDAMQQVKFGDPMDSNCDMGPLSTIKLRDNLHQQVRTSIQQGAECLCGGEIPRGEGAFYPATVLEHPQPGSPAFDDELFGPVASLFKVENEEEAIALANGHRYGLGGGIFSSNVSHAVELARTLMDTGMVNVNQYSGAQPSMPFGGVKESGYGREHGGFGLKEFVNTKAVVVG